MDLPYIAPAVIHQLFNGQSGGKINGFDRNKRLKVRLVGCGVYYNTLAASSKRPDFITRTDEPLRVLLPCGPVVPDKNMTMKNASSKNWIHILTRQIFRFSWGKNSNEIPDFYFLTEAKPGHANIQLLYLTVYNICALDYNSITFRTRNDLYIYWEIVYRLKTWKLKCIILNHW